ncbi:sigma 54-interacting transcriptional regulator [Desulfallas sp. Bu1-1]|uniref:sigma-54 interaction domain-containing protein n=1 Tax=Desulfallas sp. Bu1-1 TaxID=2787620 RepID=UPI00189F0361|nr:sigma 54-interacting transcriptional regulator [Desulfallas sp. Bu1-1]MBF7083082.1 sigma 54-interacting transcriptional regulator [Desulfallas sp. Bu1-1]
MFYPESTSYLAGKSKKEDYTAEKILNTIFENSNEGLLVIGENGEVRQVNNALASALKTTPDKMIGRLLTDVCKHNGLRRLIKVVNSGVPEFGKLDSIDGRSFLADYIPIISNQLIQGALAKIIFLTPEREPGYGLGEGVRKKKQASRNGLTVFYTVDHIIGNSPQMIDLKETLLKVAPRNSTVLITGESGTGKELFAQAIHAASLRRSGPFVKINCAAIPDTLLESEFFGYEEGAFTGSKRGGQIGKLEKANGGTVFLDEIGDLSFSLQAKLLRFIQDKEIQKLGASETKMSDVRVVAATNVNLDQMVKYKKFREDLYYRLNVVNLSIPPLRERKEDIRALVDCFIEKYNRLFGIQVTGLTQEVETIFQRYSWPGNVRELENVIERAFNVIEGNVICKKHLPAQLANILGSEGSNRESEDFQQENGFSLTLSEGQTLAEIMDQAEKIIILQALMKSKGNKAKAAQLLGISRPGLYKKLVKYNLA